MPTPAKTPSRAVAPGRTPTKAGSHGTSKPAALPKPADTQMPSDSTLPPETSKTDWSEALDLPEPAEQDVEAEITQALAHNKNKPGVELTTAIVLLHHAGDDGNDLLDSSSNSGATVPGSQQVAAPSRDAFSRQQQRARGTTPDSAVASIPTALSISPEAAAALLGRLTHLRLDRLRLQNLSVEVLSQMPGLTHVYLQHNCFTDMSALAVLPKLQFCTLSYNLIEQVSGVVGLQRLLFLDLSHNRISHLKASELPTCLKFVQIAGNPCMAGLAGTHTADAIIRRLPDLKHLDGSLEEEDEEGDDEEGEGSGSDDEGDQAKGPNSSGPGGDAFNSRLVAYALEVLEGLEAAHLRSSHSHVRASVSASAARSSALQASIEGMARLKLSTSAGVASSSSSGPAAPAPAAAAPGLRPASSLGRSSAGLAAGGSSNSSSSRPGSQGADGGVAGTPVRTASGRYLDPPLVTAGFAAAAAASGVPKGAGAPPLAPLPRPPSSMASYDALSGPPAFDLAMHMQRQQQSAAAAGGGDAAASGPGAVFGEDRVYERAVNEDMSWLQTRLQAVMDPWAAAAAAGPAGGAAARPGSATGGASGGSSAGVSGVRAELERMMDDARRRVREQRENDARTHDAIRTLRTSSSAFTELKQRFKLNAALAAGPGAASAVRASLTSSISRASGSRPVTPGVVAAALQQQLLQGGSSGGGGTGTSAPTRSSSASSARSATAAAAGPRQQQQQRPGSGGSGTGSLRASIAKLEHLASGLIHELDVVAGRPLSAGSQEQPQPAAVDAAEGAAAAAGAKPLPAPKGQYGAIASRALEAIEGESEEEEEEDVSMDDGGRDDGEGEEEEEEEVAVGGIFSSALPPNPFGA